MGNKKKPAETIENPAPAITLEDDFVFGAESEDDDDELGDITGFGNPEHFDEDDDYDEPRGCEDCAFGLCDCGYDFG